MQDFKKLTIWLNSRALVAEIYNISQSMPKAEQFGLISQLRRAAVSVPVNIAEGAGRNTKKDFANFLNIAMGSLNELETLLLICIDLTLLSQQNVNKIFEEIILIRKQIFKFKYNVINSKDR